MKHDSITKHFYALKQTQWRKVSTSTTKMIFIALPAHAPNPILLSSSVLLSLSTTFYVCLNDMSVFLSFLDFYFLFHIFISDGSYPILYLSWLVCTLSSLSLAPCLPPVAVVLHRGQLLGLRGKWGLSICLFVMMTPVSRACLSPTIHFGLQNRPNLVNSFNNRIIILLYKYA